MYFRLLKSVIENAIELHANETDQTKQAVLEQMNNYIIETSRQYREVEPQIHYDDPICRLGYLYMNAAANATLFEKVLYFSRDARDILTNSAQDTLNVLSMGGGPGTELLGLVKYLRNQDDLPPRRIDFTVIDNVFQWSETWRALAIAAEHELRSSLIQDGIEPTAIAPMFLPFDVFDHSQYRGVAGQCRAADLVVFNYIFSENKTKLDEARKAIEQLSNLTSDECVFLVIDRLESNGLFNQAVQDIFESTFGTSIEHRTIGTSLDPDEQVSDLGPLLTQNLSRTPRLTFYNRQSRNPTVFWFDVKRD